MKKYSFDQKLAIFFLLLLVITISRGVYTLYITKNYNYIVEDTCNPAQEKCFTRDCSDPNNCPPNGLTEYKKYSIPAKYFIRCSDNSCRNICSQNSICTPVTCGEDPNDTCTEV